MHYSSLYNAGIVSGSQSPLKQFKIAIIECTVAKEVKVVREVEGFGKINLYIQIRKAF